jgi:hypothetical protein
MSFSFMRDTTIFLRAKEPPKFQFGRLGRHGYSKDHRPDFRPMILAPTATAGVLGDV